MNLHEMDLLDKFTPKSIDNFIGNKAVINSLMSEVEKLYKIEKKDESLIQIVCLIGPTGSGKTLITKLVLESMNSEILEITRDNNTHKELSGLLYNFANNTRIDTFFAKKRKIVLIDNIDILVHTEKTIVTLIEQNLPILKKRKIPVLITCRINQEKKLLDLRKYIVWIKMYYPNVNELFPVLSQFLSENNYDYDDEKLLKVIKSNRCNIRETILNLWNSSDNEIQIRENLTTFRNLNNFEIVQLFFRKNYSLDQVLDLIKDDSNLTSYILYENLPEELVHNRDYKKKTGKKKLLNDYEKINRYYIFSSIFENHMYSNTDWSLSFYVSYLKLRGTNVILENTVTKTRRKTNTLRFSQILSKISHKNIMGKKINSILAENSLDYLEILAIIDSLIYKQKGEGKISQKLKKIGLNTEEMNLMNTYMKYFVD